MRIFYVPNEFSQQRQKEKKANIYPVLMAMEAQYNRNLGLDVYWNQEPDPNFNNSDDFLITEPEGIPFLDLPHPDRVWSQAKTYTSGNYKYLPGTHIMSASGCWHGKCTFCIEKNKLYEIRNVNDVIQEIAECMMLEFREIFDDSATFPTGQWLDEFLMKYWRADFKKVLKFSCNMRMIDAPYEKMKEAGFRMLLFGLESANQQTLDKIQKGTKVEDVKYIIKAAKAGLEPHLAVMFGYPWETDKDAIATLHLVHYLLKKGYAKTAQASFYRPPKEKGICCHHNHAHRCYIKKIYKIAYNPEFWFNQIKDIRNITDLQYLWQKIKTGLKEWRPS